MQGYIENEVDLNKERICAHECGRYQNTKSYGCYYGFCNSQRQCHGNITSCRNYDYKLWVCPAVSIFCVVVFVLKKKTV
jgi:hypothetical protein